MPRPFTAEDILQHQRITDLSLAPRAGLVAYVVQSIDRDADGARSEIWIAALNGSTPPRQFTRAEGQDLSPRWSPDESHLAFVSSRHGAVSQLFLIERGGGEAWQVSFLEQGVVSFEWAPHGNSLLVVFAKAVDPNWEGARPDGRRVSSSPEGPELVWKLPYKRDGLGFLLRRELHLGVLRLADGNVRQLTDGPFDVYDAAWSPDAKRIAFVRTREGSVAHATDLWVIDEGSGEVERLTSEQGTVMAPRWSPDGRWIAFSGAKAEGDARSTLWRIPSGGGAVESLGGDSPVEIVSGADVYWSGDGRRLTAIAAQRGLQHIVDISLEDGSVATKVGGLRHVSALRVTSEHLVFVSESPSSPQELRTCDPHGKDERELTSINAWWHDAQLPQVEYRRFEVPDGKGGTESIDGWYLRPRDASGPCPLLVDFHGGPASYVLLAYSSHAYWPMLCSDGWSILALNAVGSASYGPDFASRLHGKWGVLDLPQHEAAVDSLRTAGLADDRVAVCGKSYGGYLTAWALGATDRFRAAVIFAPVTNLETHYGTSDSGYYADPYSMCGEPFVNRGTSRDLSPMKHAEKARTPTLIMQGKDDERCPKCQSEELYVTIARGTSTPCRMVLYPGGSHHVLEDGKPSHRVDILRRWTQWLQRWIDVPVVTSRSAMAEDRASKGSSTNPT